MAVLLCMFIPNCSSFAPDCGELCRAAGGATEQLCNSDWTQLDQNFCPTLHFWSPAFSSFQLFLSLLCSLFMVSKAVLMQLFIFFVEIWRFYFLNCSSSAAHWCTVSFKLLYGFSVLAPASHSGSFTCLFACFFTSCGKFTCALKLSGVQQKK